MRIVNVRSERCGVYIGRGAGGYHMLNTPVGVRGWLGNPIRLTGGVRGSTLARFKRVLIEHANTTPQWRAAFMTLPEESILGCWCKPGPCHGDVLSWYWEKLHRADLWSCGASRFRAKDQFKSDWSSVLLVNPGSIGSSGAYKHIWEAGGLPVNKVIKNAVYFISANGKRRGCKPAPIQLIEEASALGGFFMTDASVSPYNIGEVEVAKCLTGLGYVKHVGFAGKVACWRPS